MARPKLIEDDKLLELIYQFFIHECNGRPSKLKKPAIAQYVSSHGYPGYAVESLRRNQIACDYIESLTIQQEEETLIALSSYKTLDVDAFLTTHRDKKALKTALIQLDCHYKSIADSSVEAIKRYNHQEEKNRGLQEQLTDSKARVEELTSTVKELQQQIRQLRAEAGLWKSVVEDYVYPDICNELLAADRELKNIDTIIANAKLEKKMITFQSKIERKPQDTPDIPVKTEPPVNTGSSITGSLLSRFEEDDV